MLTVYLGVLGLLLGSFGGLVADRLPRGESIVSGPSRCRSCGRRLNVVDLVPVAGYLVRRGRCHACGARIPRRDPLLELACGVVAAGSTLWLGPWPGVAVGLMGVGLMIAAGATASALRRQV